MNKPRYTIALSLNEEDNKKTEELKKKGIKIIEIYRAGLNYCLLKLKS